MMMAALLYFLIRSNYTRSYYYGEEADKDEQEEGGQAA